jgi:hypothetical protein
MTHTRRIAFPPSSRALGLFLVALAALSGCSGSVSADPHAPPASLEAILGSEHHRISVTSRAAERIGVQTAPVTASDATTDSGLSVVPYAALLYDADGTTFVYVNSEPLVFVREDVEVDRIEGDAALLSSGPSVGTAVVTTGAAELLGTETEIGH